MEIVGMSIMTNDDDSDFTVNINEISDVEECLKIGVKRFLRESFPQTKGRYAWIQIHAETENGEIETIFV